MIDPFFKNTEIEIGSDEYQEGNIAKEIWLFNVIARSNIKEISINTYFGKNKEVSKIHSYCDNLRIYLTESIFTTSGLLINFASDEFSVDLMENIFDNSYCYPLINDSMSKIEYNYKKI